MKKSRTIKKKRAGQTPAALRPYAAFARAHGRLGTKAEVMRWLRSKRR